MYVWFQALRVGSDQPSGLIPSQQLEEKRKAFVRPEYDYTHNSCMHQSHSCFASVGAVTVYSVIFVCIYLFITVNSKLSTMNSKVVKNKKFFSIKFKVSLEEKPFRCAYVGEHGR